MTQAEIWVRFMAGSLADSNLSVESGARSADEALEEFLLRFKATTDLTTGQVSWEPTGYVDE